MSGGQHTSGPWFAVPYGDGDDTVICRDEAGNKRIAFMAIPGSRDEQERRRAWAEIKANARLIAAAPELLGALERAVAFYDGLSRPHDAGEAQLLDTITLAIAKARGEAA